VKKNFMKSCRLSIMIKYRLIIWIYLWLNYSNQLFIFLNPIIQIAIKILLLMLVDISFFCYFSTMKMSISHLVSVKIFFFGKNSELCVFSFVSYYKTKNHSVVAGDLECLFCSLFNPAGSFFSFINPAIIYCAMFVFLKYSFWLIRKIQKTYLCIYFMCRYFMYVCITWLTQPGISSCMLSFCFFLKEVFIQAK
jgi:hypothetical protein